MTTQTVRIRKGYESEVILNQAIFDMIVELRSEALIFKVDFIAPLDNYDVAASFHFDDLSSEELDYVTEIFARQNPFSIETEFFLLSPRRDVNGNLKFSTLFLSEKRYSKMLDGLKRYTYNFFSETAWFPEEKEFRTRIQFSHLDAAELDDVRSLYNDIFAL